MKKRDEVRTGGLIPNPGFFDLWRRPKRKHSAEFKLSWIERLAQLEALGGRKVPGPSQGGRTALEKVSEPRRIFERSFKLAFRVSAIMNPKKSYTMVLKI